MVCVCVWACQTVVVPIVILHERWVVNHGNVGRPALDKPQTVIKFHSRDLRVRLVQPENDGSFRETPRKTSQDDPDPTHEYSNPMMFSLHPWPLWIPSQPSRPPLSSNTANLGSSPPSWSLKIWMLTTMEMWWEKEYQVCDMWLYGGDPILQTHLCG